jgi:hypothetical protein
MGDLFTLSIKSPRAFRADIVAGATREKKTEPQSI